MLLIQQKVAYLCNRKSNFLPFPLSVMAYTCSITMNSSTFPFSPVNTTNVLLVGQPVSKAVPTVRTLAVMLSQQARGTPTVSERPLGVNLVNYHHYIWNRMCPALWVWLRCVAKLSSQSHGHVSIQTFKAVCSRRGKTNIFTMFVLL